MQIYIMETEIPVPSNTTAPPLIPAPPIIPTVPLGSRRSTRSAHRTRTEEELKFLTSLYPPGVENKYLSAIEREVQINHILEMLYEEIEEEVMTPEFIARQDRTAMKEWMTDVYIDDFNLDQLSFREDLKDTITPYGYFRKLLDEADEQDETATFEDNVMIERSIKDQERYYLERNQFEFNEKGNLKGTDPKVMSMRMNFARWFRHRS